MIDTQITLDDSVCEVHSSHSLAEKTPITGKKTAVKSVTLIVIVDRADVLAVIKTVSGKKTGVLAKKTIGLAIKSSAKPD